MHVSGQGRVIERWVWWMVILLLFPFQMSAQPILCNGDLGDNIFSDGDFGSGPDNVVQMDPKLAPGFTYTTNVPPDDGEYTLTNNMNLWPFVFNAWLKTGDNDIDPNGYMMVVNASFQPGIFYENLITSLCDHTLYEFSADVINLIRSGSGGLIYPNVSFLLDDVVIYTTGDIPQDESWHTYGFTFVTAPGQTTVKLSLRNNAPGGIGNDLALDNIGFRACGPEASVSISPAGKICENSVFPELQAHIDADTGFLQWQISLDGQLTWNNIAGATTRTHQVQQLNAGLYFFRYLYSNTLTALSNPSCRIVSQTLQVEVVPVHFVIRDTLCEGLSFILGDSVYTESGTYQQFHTASNGCDSIVTLELIFVPDPHIEAEFGTIPASCEGATDGAVFLQSISDIRPPYFFRVGDTILPPPNTYLELPPGTYTVWVETPYGCFDNAEVTVPDGPPLFVHTDPDTLVRLGHSVLVESMTSIPVDTIYWTPSGSVSCPFCLNTYLTPFEETTFVIHVETNEGCVAEDSITVRVNRDPVLYIPNVFSPNGDQINDEFYITTDPLNVRSIVEALIFDRWGGIIARKANLITEGTVEIWDGETSSGPAMPGAYVYLITFSLADGSQHATSGDVTVIR